jgi:hypothetical protein
MKKILLLGLLFIFSSANNTFFYQNGKKIYITQLKENIVNTRAITKPKNIKYFLTQNSTKIGIEDTILISTYKNTNLTLLLNIYDLFLVKKLSNNIYLVKVKDISLTLDTANKLYEDSSVKYAHPNFIREIKRR